MGRRFQYALLIFSCFPDPLQGLPQHGLDIGAGREVNKFIIRNAENESNRRNSLPFHPLVTILRTTRKGLVNNTSSYA